MALVAPERRVFAALRNLLWTVPVAALLCCAYLLRVFFQGPA